MILEVAGHEILQGNDGVVFGAAIKAIRTHCAQGDCMDLVVQRPDPAAEAKAAVSAPPEKVVV